MAVYREFPQPFLDQLANHILWHSVRIVGYLEWMNSIKNEQQLVSDAMLVNKQWHDTFLRQIGKCTSLELNLSIPLTFEESKNKFLAKTETESKCKIYLAEELFARLIELDYLRAKKFTASWTSRYLVDCFVKKCEKAPGNWMELFMRLFLPNIKKLNIPARLVDSNVLDEFSANFEFLSGLNDILPLLLMLNRKSYQFSMDQKRNFASAERDFWLRALNTKFNANRVEKFTIEFRTRLVNWSQIKWSEFLSSLLANCPNLHEIRLNFKLDYVKEHCNWHKNDELEKRMLRFFFNRANKLLSEVLPSIEIENPTERPNFHVEIAFTTEFPTKQYQAVEHIFHLPIANKFPAGSNSNAEFAALSNFSFEEAVLDQMQADQQQNLGLTRIAKAMDRYGNVHHFKYSLIGNSVDEYDEDDYYEYGGIHDICDYDSDTGAIEY